MGSRALPRKALEKVFPGWSWFDADFYLGQLIRFQQQSALDLKACRSWCPLRQQLHYRLVGWRYGLSPHPLIEPGYYRVQCLQAGWDAPREPLAHFLRWGRVCGLAPSSVVDLHWREHWPTTLSPLGPAPLERLHPLGQAAELLSDGNPVHALERLRGWLQQGIPFSDRQALHKRAEGLSPPASPVSAELPGHLQVCGVPLHHWASHSWLQRLPYSLRPAALEELLLRPALPGQSIHVLHLPIDDSWWGPEHLSHLKRVDCVWDPSPQRVQLLNVLGVRAYCLDPEAPSNGWLCSAQLDAETVELGLPSPQDLSTSSLLLLGSLGVDWDGELPNDLWVLPAFQALAEPAVELGELESSLKQARLLASWLQAGQQLGVQLVRLNPTVIERSDDHFRALGGPNPAKQGWLPCQLFEAPLTIASLRSELVWRSQGCLDPVPTVETPVPPVSCLWDQADGVMAKAAVCISLYNYSDHILSALESVYLQTQRELELIVVDDASTDGGALRVLTWLEQHSRRFTRALLLQHQSNGGLASARNTAFAAAKADWCFVLDADNTLEPDAVATCLAMASGAEEHVAVVHPLIRDCPALPKVGASGLLSPLPWQQQRLRRGNYVDAMALVRRRAWQRVGGYAHIPGGWEDFDFWCCLIDAGFGGVQCPRVLARYNRHPDSMQASSTQPQLRALSRLLQARHPWLELPMAARDV